MSEINLISASCNEIECLETGDLQDLKEIIGRLALERKRNGAYNLLAGARLTNYKLEDNLSNMLEGCLDYEVSEQATRSELARHARGFPPGNPKERASRIIKMAGIPTQRNS